MTVSRLPAEEVQQTLRHLLTCRLNQTVVMREAKYRRFIWRPALRPRVTPSTAVLSRRCAAATSRVVKLVRPRLSQILPLLQDAELGPRIRLVHLVRDPRGTLNSQLHAADVWTRLTRGLDTYCDGLRDDLEAARSLHDPRYQRVCYERLAQQPEQVAVELYRGMRLPKPAMLHAYFQRHMNSTGPPPPPVRSRPAAGHPGWRGPPPPAAGSPGWRGPLPPAERRVAPGRTKRAVAPAGPKIAKQQSPNRAKKSQQTLLHQQQLRQRRKPKPRNREKMQYYSTYRGPGYDPYHWRKELKPEVLQQLEAHCSDVIAELEAEVATALARGTAEPER